MDFGRTVAAVLASAIVWQASFAGAQEREFGYDWHTSTPSPPTERITRENWVTVRIENFNFLNYSLKFAIEEETLEAYREVDRLWSGIAGLGGPPLAAGDSFPALLVTFFGKIKEVEQHLAAVRRRLPNTSISNQERIEVIVPAVARLNALVMELDESKGNVEEVLENVDNVASFELPVYFAVVELWAGARITSVFRYMGSMV